MTNEQVNQFIKERQIVANHGTATTPLINNALTVEDVRTLVAMLTNPGPAEPSAAPWIATAERLPEDSVEVIGFHHDWIDEDFNPRGTRVCFHNDGDRWHSARWLDEQDTYINGDERHFGDNPEGSLAPSLWTPIPPIPSTAPAASSADADRTPNTREEKQGKCVCSMNGESPVCSHGFSTGKFSRAWLVCMNPLNGSVCGHARECHGATP